ncbi:hypothetical protein BLOT_016066 [Blomia tropicalis]|nr:hypothetical protein BLOT_016066 [Blomia tropicalis]
MLGNIIKLINRTPLVKMARLIYYQSISGRQFVNTTMPQIGHKALDDKSIQNQAFQYHQNFNKRMKNFKCPKTLI